MRIYSRSIIILTTVFHLSAISQLSPDRVLLSEKFDRDLQPFAFLIPNFKPLPGIHGIKAVDCAVCHQKIYQEWRMSTHASALRDIQFQSEITKEDSPKWLCLNCHIPLQNQRDYFVTYLREGDVLKPATKPNPNFDPELQKEAITCATCHVRNNEGNLNSYIIGPNGSQAAPHPVQKNREFLRNICRRCHDPKGEAITANLVCWFETFKELQEGRSVFEKLSADVKDCVDCHMPEEKRLVADNFVNLAPKPVNQHHWTGSGIPKWFSGYDTLLDRGFKPGLDVELSWEGPLSLEGEINLKISFENRRAGHYIPTGDPERFILAIATLKDSDNRIYQREEFKIGQVWEWNPARKVSDNRLQFGEKRVWKISLALPEETGDLLFDLTVLHVRLHTANAQYIQAAQGVDESLFENGHYYIANLVNYYPFATYLHKEVIELKTEKNKKFSLQDLITLSKKERGKSLSQRLY